MKTFDIELIKQRYTDLPQKIAAAGKLAGRPLTLSEKILYTHTGRSIAQQPFLRGIDYAAFTPDRVAMQDATAQMALLQFMQAGREQVAVPTTVHCDHLILARQGETADLREAGKANREVYDFLASCCQKYGIGFWAPGSGIIHQLVLENYAFPGGMMLGTDSHTPNAGGLGMLAIGVGGADAVDVMAGLPWELKFPRLIGIRLTGKLSGWATPKDVILKVAGMLSVKGGTGAILEYFGDGARSLSATGKGSICNMGAETGATCSLFGYDAKMAAYLEATGREDVAELAAGIAAHLTGDEEVYRDPETYFDRVLSIDLSALQPHINGPYSPDRAWEIGEMKEVVRKHSFPPKIEYSLIGSCTNSSYEDLSAAAGLMQQAADRGIKLKTKLMINPGSRQIKNTIIRDGLLEIFEKAGAMVLANACGPCIGQWERKNVGNLGDNTIVHSYNRNFAKRADGNPRTHAFVTTPVIAAALAFGGSLDFNPLTDELEDKNGKNCRLKPPRATELPPGGFAPGGEGFHPPPAAGKAPEVIISPDSRRLQILTPFPPHQPGDFRDLGLLIKIAGKCTTDHISMAGPWLRYRGHLDRISGNLLLGAVNAFNNKTNLIKNQLSGEYGHVPAIARLYKNQGVGTIIVGDENYGEGSSREHAAMEPRHLGVLVILVRSFARIHETNLKKQGILAVTFRDPADYERICEDDRFELRGLEEFGPGSDLQLVLRHTGGQEEIIALEHTYNEAQVEWFKAGSALNLMRG